MPNVTSGSYLFDKNYAIDQIIEDAYERIGFQGVSGYQLKSAKRTSCLISNFLRSLLESTPKVTMISFLLL